MCSTPGIMLFPWVTCLVRIVIRALASKIERFVIWMPIFARIVVVLVSLLGIALFTIGWLVWKKQRLDLLHVYHRKNVKAEDGRVFAIKMGQGLCVMGAGIVLASVLLLCNRSWGWLVFILSFEVSLVILIRTMLRYNGSVM